MPIPDPIGCGFHGSGAPSQLSGKNLKDSLFISIAIISCHNPDCKKETESCWGVHIQRRENYYLPFPVFPNGVIYRHSCLSNLPHPLIKECHGHGGNAGTLVQKLRAPKHRSVPTDAAARRSSPARRSSLQLLGEAVGLQMQAYGLAVCRSPCHLCQYRGTKNFAH